jgi:hypothetical protein
MFKVAAKPRSIGIARRSAQSTLTDQPKRQRIAVHLTFARLQGGDDYENDVENVQNREKSKTDQHEAEKASHEVVDQHRDLKV